MKLNHRGIRNLLKREWLEQPNDNFFIICTVKKTLKNLKSCFAIDHLLFSGLFSHFLFPFLMTPVSYSLDIFTCRVTHAFINADLTMCRDLGIR